MTTAAVEEDLEQSPPVRPRRVLASFAWNSGSHVLNIVNQLGTVPLFIHSWGNVLYGDWLSLSAVVGYLALADGGMQNYVVTLLTQRAVQGKWEELRRELASATAMYLFAVGLAVAATLGMSVLLPFGRWFSGRPAAALAPLIVVLLGLQVSASLTNGFISGLYRVLGRNDLWLAAGFLYRAALVSTTIAVLAAGGGARMLAAGQLAVGAVAVVVVLVDVRRRDPRLRPGLAGARRSVAIGFLAPSLLFLLLTVANGLSIQGTVLVLSSTLGAVAVVVFSTTRAVANVVRQVVAVLLNVVWPELTRLEAAGRKDRIALAHRLVVKLAAAAAVPLSAWLFFSGPALYRLWTGGRTVPDVALMRLLLVDQMLATPWFASSALLTATNRHRALSLLFVSAGAASLVLCLLLVPRFGLNAVGVVTLGLNATTFGVLVPRWAQQTTGEKLSAYWTGIYAPVVVLVLACLAASGGASFVAPGLVLGIAAPLVASVAVGAVVFWWLLGTQERSILAKGLSMALARRRAAPEMPS